MGRKSRSKGTSLLELNRLVEEANLKIEGSKWRFYDTLSPADADNFYATLEANRRLKVKPAFTKNDTIVLHFNHITAYSEGKKERKYSEHISTHKFGALYSAKCFIDTVMELAEDAVPTPSQKWLGPDQLCLNEWIVISSDDLSSTSLEDLIEYKYTPEEKKWRLPTPYPTYANNIVMYHHGVHPQISSRARYVENKPPLTDTEAKKHNVKRGRADAKHSDPKPSSKPVSAKEPRPKSDVKRGSGDLVTLEAMGFDPKEARQALRKAAIPKPDGGWKWTKEEAQAIKPKIEAAIKKLRAKKNG